MVFSRKVKGYLAALGIFGLLSTPVAALPAPLTKRQAITALSTAQVSAFRPYSYYATTGYCKPNVTITWTCGSNCKGNPDFIPVASGGNGGTVQNWYVGYDPDLKEVIVSHQGTDPGQLIQDLEDGNIILRNLDEDLFPGLDDSIKAHSGFADAHERSAPDVLAAVNKTITKYGTKKVTVTGHSLGAALSLLDAVYLPLNIPGITTRFVGYGLPRVGNQEFADYLDAQPTSVTHVNNKLDMVPILPGRFLGYHHPSGEIHIQASGQWLSCPGQDNTSSLCTTGNVTSIFVGVPDDHDGPYDGVPMGSATCDM